MLKAVVPVRDTSLDHIRNALIRNLEKRLKEDKCVDSSIVKRDLSEFSACFPAAQLKMNDELVIEVNGEDILVRRKVHRKHLRYLTLIRLCLGNESISYKVGLDQQDSHSPLY